jgi:hypothetical protein
MPPGAEVQLGLVFGWLADPRAVLWDPQSVLSLQSGQTTLAFCSSIWWRKVENVLPHW